jgi:NAD(P)-dependent dehydrogenase (short-subunit alcohol dehydrogenase family)
MTDRPVVLITGASRGIGAATALAFGQAGWRVAITARTLTEGQAFDHQLRRPDGALLKGSLAGTAEAVRATGAEVFAHPMDLLDTASLERALDAVLDHFGRVDVLINNAVYQDREMNERVLALSDDMLLRTLLGNVVAPFHLAQRLLPTLVQQGGGRIINVVSGAGQNDPPLPGDQGGWGFAYGASKAALIRLAGSINVELGPQGVWACSANPGIVTTEAVTATLGEDGALARRYGAVTPGEIAQALCWLGTHAGAPAYAKAQGVVQLQQLVKQPPADPA